MTKPKKCSACGHVKPASPWENDELQFARLLGEIMATSAITKEVMTELCDSMSLDEDGVEELMERAQAHWDATKAALYPIKRKK